MKLDWKKILPAATMAFLAGNCVNGSELPTGNMNPAYFPSNVQAQLQVGVKPGTEAVHFIRDTSDSKIITKTYVLKHANPYEIRPYLRNMVQTMRTNFNVFNGDKNKALYANPMNFMSTSAPIDFSRYYNQYLRAPAGVECMVFMDGTALLIISAEEYRFKDNTNGMGIDSIVAKLDAKGIKNSSAQPKYLYFPKNRPASELKSMVEAVGANLSNDTVELIGGKDKVRDDKDLNVLFFNTALYSRKNIEAMLELYDVPHPQVRIRYIVYELMAENDGKIGADFQAWKNNEGAQFFSTGATFRDNWSSTYAGGMIRNGGQNNAQYINFNPKWNTRYLDFLVSKSKARVAVSGELRARSNETTQIVRKTGLFVIDAKESKVPGATVSSGYVKDGSALEMTNATGYKVTANGPFTVVKVVTPSTTCYDLQGWNGTVFTIAGYNKTYPSVEGAKIKDDSSIKFLINAPANQEHGNTINTQVATGFNFDLQITPSVTARATVLDVTVKSTSLMGYASNGNPRLVSNVTSNKVMIGNEKENRFVIGGITKSELVRGSVGLPILKDIPLLGWIFSTESESTKNSRLVLVAECSLVTPASEIPKGIQADIISVDEAVNKKKDNNINTYGYRQFGLDSER